jgi:V8-like Glu-specific endopeptidase
MRPIISLLAASAFTATMLSTASGVATALPEVPAGWTISPAKSIDGKTVSSQAQKSQETKAFWTPERMHAAVPLPAPVVDAEGVYAEAAGRNTQAGAPGSVPPAAPTAEFTTNAVSNSDSATVGRLFFEDPTNQTLYICSAAVVNAGNNRTVQTAAHCMYDPARQVEYTGHFFVPGYINNTAPFGGWDMSVYVAHYKWKEEHKYHFDYAFMRMAPRSDGVNIQQVVGALGFAYNQGNDFLDVMGYPAVSPYNGEQQKRDFTNSTIVDFVEDGSLEGWFDRVISDFGPGSSGGPFVREYNTSTRLGYARGTNSFRFANQPYVFSPYFDGDTKVGFDFAGEA